MDVDQATTAAASTAANTATQAANVPKPAMAEDSLDVAAAMVDRGETTLDRAAQHMVDSFIGVDLTAVRLELAKRLPDGHSEKPREGADPEPQLDADESKVATPQANPLQTVEEAAADLEANPARTSSLSKDGHVVREG